MRRKIKSELKNLTTNEITNHNSNCIVNQNKIKYQDNDTSYEIRIKNNEIIVIRDNSKFTHAMQFQKDKTHKSNYLLKEPDLNLELNIKTKELDIKEDKIGTKEYRCVVIDGKIYNISRLTFCQNHKIENKVLDFALNIVKNYPGTYVVDLMEDSNGLIDIVEFNPIEASGMYLYNSICDKSLDLKHDNTDLDKKIIAAEVIKPVLNSRCKWNNYGMFASDLRSICMIGERGALFFSDSFDDTNLYGYETESLKLSRQFEPINDL